VPLITSAPSAVAGFRTSDFARHSWVPKRSSRRWQVNLARPHKTDAHKCAWHTFFRRSLLQRCVPADARVDVYLWIRTATIAASMTA